MVHVRRRMHEELKGVGASTRLAAQVAACVGKALRVLAEKAEYMAATGAPLSATLTHSQRRQCLFQAVLMLFLMLSLS